MSKSAHEQSFYRGRILDHASVSRILGLLALLTLRKWPPMLAKTMIVFSVSQFFVKKQRVLYERIIRAKMIDINTKIEKKTSAGILHGIF